MSDSEQNEGNEVTRALAQWHLDLPAVPPKAALARWARSLANAAKTAEHPFNAGLMLEALVSEARSTLNSASRRP